MNFKDKFLIVFETERIELDHDGFIGLSMLFSPKPMHEMKQKSSKLPRLILEAETEHEAKRLIGENYETGDIITVHLVRDSVKVNADKRVFVEFDE